MTEKTMVMGARVPLETKLALSDIDLRKLLENIAKQRECGEIDIVDNEIVLPENVDSDPDGEWVREMAHELNVDIKTFKRKIEGMR